MRRRLLTAKDYRQINKTVEFYVEHRQAFETFAKSLMVNLSENAELAPYIHFLKYRTKDPSHLRRKLTLKAKEARAKGRNPGICEANLFVKINDLAGLRLLHLHTEQMTEINRIILKILKEHRYRLIEGPTAICWDLEYEEIFNEIGIDTDTRDSMYTSVHYIIEANQKTKISAELQVRTLMEEVWGEVSHRIDYPTESKIRACRDQLKVLARLTSGCTRLVDSIFSCHNDG